ncbi:hypothetical protein KUV62_15985 [Salipiger bermudensis]|uniref:DUF6639 family protein n=1 Tax=Salipiger bermudensis TaxID=344736 RepID=UPI001C998C72|nr:DUF6639 family protein [Salipiger bermudensis]MBY6005425.1 hypothetical protein [Salipiger bermudensis]
MRLPFPLLALVLALPASAETLCEGTPVRMTAPPAQAETLCTAVQQALPRLAACGLALETPVSITLTDSLPGDCLGLYHCGEQRIELLAPEALSEQRRTDGVFAALPDARYFDSIVMHELAHAAHDARPCPSGLCLATSEYLAYNFQILGLAPEDRARVEASLDMQSPVSHDAVNKIVLLFAPDAFAARAWAHLNQRDDPCAYLRHVAAGDFTFDRPAR